MLAASGVSDAAGLCSQLGAIAADASAAAKKKPTGDDSGAEDAENLQRKHADVTARFDMLVTGYSATMSAEARPVCCAAHAPASHSRSAPPPAEQEAGAGGAGGHEGVAGRAGGGACLSP